MKGKNMVILLILLSIVGTIFAWYIFKDIEPKEIDQPENETASHGMFQIFHTM